MNKVLMGAIALVGMVAVSTAQAESDIHPFAKANIGYSTFPDGNVYGSIRGISVGITIDKQNDIEFEYARAKSDSVAYLEEDYFGDLYVVRANAKIDTAMVNYRYIFNVEDKLRPYFFGGIGHKRFEIEGDSDSSFAYQIGFGTKYFINENVYLDASYRHQESSDFTVNGETFDFDNNNLVFGIAYQW